MSRPANRLQLLLLPLLLLACAEGSPRRASESQGPGSETGQGSIGAARRPEHVAPRVEPPATGGGMGCTAMGGESPLGGLALLLLGGRRPRGRQHGGRGTRSETV